jgi:hypothetical protein
MEHIAIISIAISLLSLAVTVVNGWLIWSASRRVTKLDRLETNLELQTKQLIDARLKVEQAEREREFSLIAQRVSSLERWQMASDRGAAELLASITQLELRLTGSIANLQVELAKTVATKDDLKDLAREVSSLGRESADTRG